MKFYTSIVLVLFFSAFFVSCGVSGDPGHCYISIDWEYYNEQYGVNFYQDNNDDVPEFEFIEPEKYYDSYPGKYVFNYKSEDEEYWYSYEGTYELIQNLGYDGGLLHDGLDGVDYYFDLYLHIYDTTGLDQENGKWSDDTDSELNSYSPGLKYNSPLTIDIDMVGALQNEVPVRIESANWEQQKGNWSLLMSQVIKIYKK